MTCSVSMPGLMIFRATRARTGLSCSAMIDRAHAPLADLLEEHVRADAVAGTIGKGRVPGNSIVVSPFTENEGQCFRVDRDGPRPRTPSTSGVNPMPIVACHGTPDTALAATSAGSSFAHCGQNRALTS